MGFALWRSLHVWDSSQKEREKKKVWNRVDFPFPSSPFPFASPFSFVPFSFRQPPSKISWINCCFFVLFCFHVVRSLKKRTSSKKLHVLSCFVQFESVLWISFVVRKRVRMTSFSSSPRIQMVVFQAVPVVIVRAKDPRLWVIKLSQCRGRKDHLLHTK